MNISSILITIVGIVIILALYVMSRAGQRNIPTKGTTELPEIKDENGNLFTSVLDDIPSSDKPSTTNVQQKTTNAVDNTAQKSQIVLFISSQNDEGLDGNLIKETLLNNKLVLGDKDIYHYLLDANQQSNSLFRVANGVEPWTLTDNDLIDKKIAGISLVMLVPNALPNKDALNLFVQMADTISAQVHGVLKNQNQEILTPLDRQKILNL